jgi:hypothetical protein
VAHFLSQSLAVAARDLDREVAEQTEIEFVAFVAFVELMIVGRYFSEGGPWLPWDLASSQVLP